MLSGHAAASLTFHSVSSTSAPLAPACGTPASKARRQANARLGAGPCGIKASASVRLAYGYAQYGYAQWENFLISPNAPLAGLALLVISLRPYCYCVVTVGPGGADLTRRMPHLWRSGVYRSGPTFPAGSLGSAANGGNRSAAGRPCAGRKSCWARSPARDTIARSPGGIKDMALGMYFAPGTFTPERYDNAIKRLEEAGAGAPPEGSITLRRNGRSDPGARRLGL
jgi:hypothetical protein